MNIEWAPLNVSVERRLQTLTLAIHVIYLVFGQLASLIVIVLTLYSGHWILKLSLLAYFTFVYADWKIAENGGRGAGCQWFRSLQYWKYFNNYFPVDLVKTAELRPDRNYMLALFPHGILSFGSFANFNNNYSKFAELFPGIRSKMLTLSSHFKIPFYREPMLACGMAAASKDCIMSLLTASTDPTSPNNADGYTSNAIILVVGGAQESFNSVPKNYHLVLKSRKGFVRLAIQSGTPIVPVIAFNEVDVFDQVRGEPGSKFRCLQEWIKRKTGISPLVFSGRGFFQYSFGLIPQRRTITTVVGAPIEVPHHAAPCAELVEKMHAQFCDELILLFETHKSKFIEGHEDVQMVIE